MATRRRLLAGAGALAAVAAFGRGLAAREAGAEAFIREVGTQTVEILRRPRADAAERLRDLVGVLNRSTDLDLVGRLVMGQHWRTATEQQRARFLELFRALVVRTMADGLNRYSGETFEITGSRAIDERDVVVSTLIVAPSSPQPTRVDWRVRQQDGRFQIIDIIAEGVSMVVTQRSEVAEVVGQRGIDGLLATLEDRLAGRA
ncbi:MAG TPA: ABC transporter substrate-binding protein [Geminicoccaceae bacterium]|nr:ABC transporter substrate-binding protein [Geminicoccaceae bacterium]